MRPAEFPSRFVLSWMTPEEWAMKHLFCTSLLLIAAAGATAKTKADEEAVRKLPQAFCGAWAKHDGHELAKIMADDVDEIWMGPCASNHATA
ncbi:MAG: hypothetical protein DMG39_09320 [Acidobacteria bacterium]|nr:MAG: hypothetical protein DMG39_09320 [Acidobacteriota bacterium]